MNLRQSLSEQAIGQLIDPRTGAPLRPLGVLPSGKVVWPIMGASEDDDSSKDDSDKDDDTGDGKDDSSKDDADKSKDSDKDADKGDPEAKITALEDEKNRHVRRRQEAERERDELKQRLEALEAKDTPELEQLTKKVSTLESDLEVTSTALKESRLENAFLKDNTYTWHNPGRALKLADLSDVEIDDDGTVHGLKAALDKLAKSDPYLLKKEGDKDSSKDDDKDKPDTSGTGKTGKGKAGSKESEEARRKALHEKYPALRR